MSKVANIKMLLWGQRKSGNSTSVPEQRGVAWYLRGFKASGVCPYRLVGNMVFLCERG